MRRRAHSIVSRLLPCALALVAATAGAQGRFVEDIRVSRTDGQAEVIIDLACQMRYVADVQTQAGVLLEIRVAPFDSCRTLGLGTGITSELYRPPEGRLAYLAEVEYTSLGIGNSLLMLQFDRPVRYRVSQSGSLRSIQLTIEVEQAQGREEFPAPAAQLPVPVQPAPSGLSAGPADQSAGATPLRSPLRMTVVEPAVIEDYILNLQSTREPVELDAVSTISVPIGQQLYVSETTVNGATWYRLRLGFFASEAQASDVLESLADAFPRAWIGRSEPEEVRLAASRELEQGDTAALPTVSGNEPIGEETLADAIVSGTLSADRITALMSEAREAMLSSDWDTPVRIYTRLLQEPGDHRQEAREFLGLARERNNQLAHARTEYQAYLAEFPDDEGTQRVEQRLSGLLVASETARQPLARAQAADGAQWDFSTGLSQYYRRHVDQFDEEQPEIVTLSALLTDLDLTLRRTGATVDMSSRVTINNFYDLIDEADTGRANQNRNRISYAYVELDDTQRDWALRIGRYRLHNWGVLGRFDGAHFSYGWNADQRVHVIAGYPVESTRNSVDSNRQFVSVAVDFDNFAGDWDFSTFLTQQTIEGVVDRQAVGAEVRYFGATRSLTGLLDYDVEFGELNTALLLGTWRLANGLTLNGLLDYRLNPVLTTRNALIGQPVSTIEEMLLVWTEEEIRQLALDRTARSQTVTVGFAAPISERFQLNADITMNEIDGTVRSGGVFGLPGTGPQTYYSTSVIGSSLFGAGDVSILTMRYNDSDTFTSSVFSLDMRFPIGRRLRLNPRLQYSVWENISDGRKRETIRPSFRLLLTFANRNRLELEIGSSQLTRSDINGQRESSGNYINLGYRADF